MYTSGVFFNSGNYKGTYYYEDLFFYLLSKIVHYFDFSIGFGDTKIIPGVSESKLGTLIGTAKFLGLQSEVESKWVAVKDKMYSLSEKEKQLGLGEKVCHINSHHAFHQHFTFKNCL